jgi:hypothetical protein
MSSDEAAAKLESRINQWRSLVTPQGAYPSATAESNPAHTAAQPSAELELVTRADSYLDMDQDEPRAGASCSSSRFDAGARVLRGTGGTPYSPGLLRLELERTRAIATDRGRRLQRVCVELLCLVLAALVAWGVISLSGLL